MADINQILKGIIAVQNRTLGTIKQVIIQKQYPEDLTKMGNQFNGVQQLVKLNSEGKIPVQLLNDYTAFEVFAHNYDIPVGECTELSGYVTNTIPANMTHNMYIRSFSDQKNIDVTIDWGDGIIENLKDLNSNNVSYGSEVRYFSSHTYNNTGKYIIKIYGKDYWAILPDKSNAGTNPNNLICRVFDQDLPIAKHLYNLSSFCYGAIRLLNVNIWKGNFNSNNIQNVAYLFCHCRNLLNVIGFYYNDTIQAENNIFENCWSLITTDYQLKPTGSKSLCFHRCKNLTTPIENLLPERFDSPNIKLDRTFNECKLLSGTIPADKLWNNKNVTWSTMSKCFYGCSSAIKEQAPISWGGTASDDIIEISYDERIKKLEETISNLASRLENV